MKILSETTCIVCQHPCPYTKILNDDNTVEILCHHIDCKRIIDKIVQLEQEILNLEYDIFLKQCRTQCISLT